MYVTKLVKTMGRRPTKLGMPTKHSAGKVLKFSWEARLIRRASFQNSVLEDHAAMAMVEVGQNKQKKPAETSECLSEQIGGKVYSKKGCLIFRKEGMKGWKGWPI